MLHEGTETAVAGATVTLDDAPLWTALSDSEGTCQFGDVPAGFHILRVTGDWYYPVEAGIDVVVDSTSQITVHLASLTTPQQPDLPAAYRLDPNYPNPFNPATTIRYALKSDGLTRLRVYNVLGECVAELVNMRQAAGEHAASFNAAALPSGMYFYRLESGGFIEARKMVLLK